MKKIHRIWKNCHAELFLITTSKDVDQNTIGNHQFFCLMPNQIFLKDTNKPYEFMTIFSLTTTEGISNIYLEMLLQMVSANR